MEASWTVTLSHELLEMLADPWINWCAQGDDGKIYALEVCDAVEADRMGYEIDGVLVSDFITPSWFEPTHADRVDFKGRIVKTARDRLREVTCRCWTLAGGGRKSQRGATLHLQFRGEAGGSGAT